MQWLPHCAKVIAQEAVKANEGTLVRKQQQAPLSNKMINATPHTSIHKQMQCEAKESIITLR